MHKTFEIAGKREARRGAAGRHGGGIDQAGNLLQSISVCVTSNQQSKVNSSLNTQNYLPIRYQQTLGDLAPLQKRAQGP